MRMVNSLSIAKLIVHGQDHVSVTPRIRISISICGDSYAQHCNIRGSHYVLPHQNSRNVRQDKLKALAMLSARTADVLNMSR